MITVLSPSPALDVTYLVDRLEDGAIHRPREVLRLAGGKGLNLARAARVLGERMRVVAPLGGHIGALVAELAAAEDIDLDPVPAEGETRTCVSVIPDAGAPTEFYENAIDLLDARRLFDRLEGRASGWVVVAGRLPAGDALGPALASVERVAIDSSGDGLGALIDEVRPALLKVNAAEAAELHGASGPAVQLASALRARTGGTVVVTDGAAGAAGVDAGGAWRVAPDPRPGRYAIGSGDSFFAGLLTALAAGAPLAEAMRTASAAGSANTRAPGAGIFTRADFDAAHDRIEVHPA